jgi:hypothetical protein
MNSRTNLRACDGAVQRSSIITNEPDHPQADAALAQAQGLKPGSIPVTLSAYRSQTGTPVILIEGAPPNATLKLLRGNEVVKTTSTGPIGGSPVTMTDDQAPPGLVTYRLMQVQTGKPDLLLAQAVVNVQLQSAVVPEQAQPAIGATTATTFTADLLSRLAPQFTPLATVPSGAAAAAQPVPVTAALPTAGALPAGNQVTLNQFFGRTGFPGAAAQTTPGRKRSLLFHHAAKQRPQVRVVGVAGLDSQVPVQPSHNVPDRQSVGGSAPRVLQATPTTPATPAPAKDDEKIPGTGG